MIYLDTSAFAKLVWAESGSTALQQFLTERADAVLVSSALLAVEVRRAVLRVDPAQTIRADLLLTRVGKPQGWSAHGDAPRSVQTCCSRASARSPSPGL